MTKLCTLSVAAGDGEECPHGWCAFWERGGAVVEPGCAIDRLGIRIDEPELARYLLDLRRELEAVRDAEASQRAAKHLAELAPSDVSGA